MLSVVKTKVDLHFVTCARISWTSSASRCLSGMSTKLSDLVQRFFTHQAESWQPRDSARLPQCLSRLLELCLSTHYAYAVPDQSPPETAFTPKLPEPPRRLVSIPSDLTLPVALPGHNQAWAQRDMVQLFRFNLELVPLAWCLYASSTHPASWSALDDVTCEPEHYADSKLSWRDLLLCALVTAKLAACMDFTNSKSGMDTLAWNCLEAVNVRFTKLLRSSASEQLHADEVIRQETELSVLLIELLLPAMRQSARDYSAMQYRGQAAVKVALSAVHCGTASYPAIADAVLNNSRCC